MDLVRGGREGWGGENRLGSPSGVEGLYVGRERTKGELIRREGNGRGN